MAINAVDLDFPELKPEVLAPEVPRSLLLKPEDAAKVLGVGRQWMYDRIHDGSIVSIRMQRKILVPYQALVDWVTLRMQEARDVRAH